jgi:hypothetical protein
MKAWETRSNRSDGLLKVCAARLGNPGGVKVCAVQTAGGVRGVSVIDYYITLVVEFMLVCV